MRLSHLARSRALLSLGVLLILPAVGFATATYPCRIPADLHRLEYDIHWMGGRVGELVIAFERFGEDTRVRNYIDVDARIFAHSLFRFRHASEEHWHKDTLVGFSGETVDNGRHRVVKVTLGKTTFHVDGKGGPYEVSRQTPLLSAWCETSIWGPQVIEPTKGRIKAVTAQLISGNELRMPSGRVPQAKRLRLDGELQAEIWYDPRGLMIFARFPVKGGTTGTIELRVP